MLERIFHLVTCVAYVGFIDIWFSFRTSDHHLLHLLRKHEFLLSDEASSLQILTSWMTDEVFASPHKPRGLPPVMYLSYSDVKVGSVHQNYWSVWLPSNCDSRSVWSHTSHRTALSILRLWHLISFYTSCFIFLERLRIWLYFFFTFNLYICRHYPELPHHLCKPVGPGGLWVAAHLHSLCENVVLCGPGSCPALWPALCLQHHSGECYWVISSTLFLSLLR